MLPQSQDKGFPSRRLVASYQNHHKTAYIDRINGMSEWCCQILERTDHSSSPGEPEGGKRVVDATADVRLDLMSKSL